MPVEDFDSVAIEHRLTNLENICASGFLGTNGRLDTINGSIGRHEEWIQEQRIKAAEARGFIEGRAALRKRDLAIVGGIVSVLVAVVQAIPALVRMAQ